LGNEYWNKLITFSHDTLSTGESTHFVLVTGTELL